MIKEHLACMEAFHSVLHCFAAQKSSKSPQQPGISAHSIESMHNHFQCIHLKVELTGDKFNKTEIMNPFSILLSMVDTPCDVADDELVATHS
jgi:hypothetical protein